MGTDEKELVSSALLRSLKLSGLLGRVGVSMVGNRLADIGRSDEVAARRKADNLVRNAHRVAATLGELKGAAMKVGQMLSLHEGLLPPEVAAVLSSLQKEAPRVPAEVMRYEVEGALGSLEAHFAELDDEASAAASIGQVYHARLHDGRDVAVKVQYPLIDQIVTADLGNLRRFFKALFGLLSEVDFEPLWEELRDRLIEELDYEHEAAAMRQLAALHADCPDIIIPGVVAESSTRTVLTMERVDGISPADACSDRYPQDLKDRWGQVLLEFQFRGLLQHRVLHADPNLANFAFREDGRVIVYDFGCVKRVSPELARGYARLFLAVLEERHEDVPGALEAMGVAREGHGPIPRDLSDPYVEVFASITRSDPPYTFGEDDLYDRLMGLGMANWSRAIDISFPSDIIFIDRSFAGHIGNLSRLRATGPWRDMVSRYARQALAPSDEGETAGCR